MFEDKEFIIPLNEHSKGGILSKELVDKHIKYLTKEDRTSKHIESFPKFDWANLPSGTSEKFKDKIKLTSESRKFPPSSGSRSKDFKSIGDVPIVNLKLTYHELKRKLRSDLNYAKSTVMYYRYLIKVAEWEINRR